MSDNITIKQGSITATVIELSYSPANGGIDEDNVAYVVEETINGETDVKLEEGPAVLSYRGRDYPVKVTCWELEQFPGEDLEDAEIPNLIEVNVDEGGLPKMADALNLLEGYSRQQKAGLGL